MDEENVVENKYEYFDFLYLFTQLLSIFYSSKIVWMNQSGLKNGGIKVVYELKFLTFINIVWCIREIKLCYLNYKNYER